MKPPRRTKPVPPAAAVPPRGTRADQRRDVVQRLRGIVKLPPGAPSLAEEMAEHKRREKELEDRLAKRKGV